MCVWGDLFRSVPWRNQVALQSDHNGRILSTLCNTKHYKTEATELSQTCDGNDKMMVMVIMMMMVVEEGSTRHTYEGNGDVMILAQRLGPEEHSHGRVCSNPQSCLAYADNPFLGTQNSMLSVLNNFASCCLVL